MKNLRERILKDGRCYSGGILKVDSFINHQMDPYLMKQIAIELIRRFADAPINKILTVEASGIAPAIMLGYLMELPVVFAKKKKPSSPSSHRTDTMFWLKHVKSFRPPFSKGGGVLGQRPGPTSAEVGTLIAHKEFLFWFFWVQLVEPAPQIKEKRTMGFFR